VIAPILVSPRHNCVSFPCGARIHFSRKWAATMLALLLVEAHNNRALTAARLNAELQRLGKTKPLTRAQQSILVETLRSECGAIKNCSFVLEADKATVGPWRLRLSKQCHFVIEDETPGNQVQDGLQQRSDNWAWPKLVPNGAYASLLQVLSVCLTSDAFALDGDFVNAVESLQPVFDLPLSEDGRALLLLRKAVHHKREGEFGEARECVQQILAIPSDAIKDQPLLLHAKTLLDRFDYDESPGTEHERLWSMMALPPPTFGHDVRAMAEWHNLRGMLARRRLQGIASGLIDAAEGETIQLLHQLALQHLESAAYCALSLRDFSLLQSIVGNTAFHLQNVLLQELSTVTQVFDWYALMVNYAEKLDIGKESAWDYIFLGQFWLDYHQSLESSGRYRDAYGAYNGISFIGRAHPSEERFYVTAIERLNDCGDMRQVAIARINYTRFAQWNLSETKHANSAMELRRLLNTSPNLRELLRSDGYGPYLPA
jgi:hypothetical protein